MGQGILFIAVWGIAQSLGENPLAAFVIAGGVWVLTQVVWPD